MPRLEGAQKNTGLYVILVVAVALIVLWLLQYYGVIHVINGFGLSAFGG